MAAMYGGEPLWTVETPAFHPSALGRSLYTIDGIRYRVGHNSLTIYGFDHESSDEEADGEEESLDDGTDCRDEETFYNLLLMGDAVHARGSGERPSVDDRDVPEAAGAEGGKKEGPAEAGPSSEPQKLPPAGPPLAYWLPRRGGAVPRDAVIVGTDLDGGPLYVGRACVYGELLAGKVAPHHRVCYVACEGRELAFEKYEVLVVKRGRVEWVRAQHGSFPFDAFPAGLTLRNQRVYAARARVNDILTPGRLVIGENECRISYDMKEYMFPEYEILTVRSLDPNQYQIGMVRHVSAEALYNSTHTGRHYRGHPDQNYDWCGTNHASDDRLRGRRDEEGNSDDDMSVDGDDDSDDDDDDDDDNCGGGDIDHNIVAE